MYTIVIPTYNEKENITKLVGQINKLYGKESSRLSILVADDSSPDGTKAALEDYLKKNKPSLKVDIITKAKKSGLKDAYFNAFRHLLKTNPKLSGVIQMDADLSHDPKYLVKHLESLDAGYDLSIGSRYTKGGGISNWGLSRVLLSRVGNTLNRVILSRKVHDYTGGFNGISAAALQYAIKPNVVSSSGYYFLTEMKYRIVSKGYKLKEFPIIFTDRVEGESKMGGSIIFESIKQLISIRFKK